MALKLDSDLNQNIQMIAGLIILGVGVGIYYFFIPNLTAKKNDLALAKNQEEVLTHDNLELQNAKRDVETAVSSFKLDLNRISRVYPAFEEMPELYVQMESMVNRLPSNLKFKYVLGIPTTDATGVKIPVNITASGSYADLKTLIATLEETIRPITLAQVGFEPTKDQEGKLTGGYNLSAQGYVRSAGLSPAYATAVVNN